MVYQGQQFDSPADALAHYGVKGMKWGIRKSEDSSGSSGSSSAEKPKKQSKGDGTVASIAKARGKFVEDWGDPTAAKSSSTGSKRGARSEAKAAALDKELADLKTNGLKSEALAGVYGKALARRADKSSDRQFKFFYGQTKEQLLANETTAREKQRDKHLADAKVQNAGKLTRNEKVAIGAAVVGAGLLVYGTYKYKQVTREFAPGEKIPLNSFLFHTSQSQRRSWTGDTSISKEAFAKLDDTDVRLPIGTTFQRLAGSAEDSVRDAAYVTHTAEDAARYQAAFTRELAGRGLSEIHTMTIKPSQALIGPSEKKRVTMFQDLLETDSDFRSLVQRTVLFHGGGDASLDLNRSPRDAGLKYYNTMVANQGSKDAATMRYFDYVKSKGYNILTDDMDAGVIGDSPMIILDGAVANVAGSRVLTSDDITKASNSLTELAKRK